MQTDLPLAALFGLSIAIGVYAFLTPDPFVATGAGAMYAAASYFYLAFDAALLGSPVGFSDWSDRTGYAVGMFGLSVTPVAVAGYEGHPDGTALPFAVLFLGAIAFLHLVTQADRQTESA